MASTRIPELLIASPRWFLFPLFFFISILPVYPQKSILMEHFSLSDGLASDKVFDAVQTNDGLIWFATSKGICQFDGIRFQCFFTKDGLPLEITGLYVDVQGKLWCWTADGNIFYLENDRLIPFPGNHILSARINNNIINTIGFDELGSLWIATVIPGNLIKYKQDSGLDKIQEKEDCSFYIRQTGKDFIYGSLKSNIANNKLCLFTDHQTYSFNLSEKGNFSKSSVFPLNGEEFLYAKGQEIIRIKKDKILQRSFTEKNIQDIICDNEGKIWVGLYMGGVVCYPEGFLSSPGLINYLGNKSISSVLEDNAGNIWFTTLEDGIYYLPARSDLRYTSPKIYSQKNPAATNEQAKAVIGHPMEQPGSAILYGDRVITTDTAFNDTLPPSVFISGIKIMDQDTLVLPQYLLPYDMNFIKINFAGIARGNPEALKYKYRLNGVDKNFIYSDNTFVQYTTLPPGNYFFTVSAMNKNGIWSETPATFSLLIQPPFWKTWWFISIQAILITLLVSALFFYRISQIKKREKEKSEISRQMAHAELNALRAQMNPHFIFNTLSSIQHFITINETEDALKYLSKFARLMRKIMDHSKKASVALKDELEAINLYLELEALRFKNKFEYSVAVDNNIDPGDDEIPPMLIQPYIENAILHGLIHLENKKGCLRIDLRKREDLLVCTVEDNGIGREKSKEINRLKQVNHVSQGMSITKNRLEILNTMHRSDLSVTIEDIYIEQEVAGTRVEIFIPL